MEVFDISMLITKAGLSIFMLICVVISGGNLYKSFRDAPGIPDNPNPPPPPPPNNQSTGG